MSLPTGKPARSARSALVMAIAVAFLLIAPAELLHLLEHDECLTDLTQGSQCHECAIFRQALKIVCAEPPPPPVEPEACVISLPDIPGPARVDLTECCARSPPIS